MKLKILKLKLNQEGSLSKNNQQRGFEASGCNWPNYLFHEKEKKARKLTRTLQNGQTSI